MKVLVITTSYPDFEGSTRGIFIRRLCRELACKGVDVSVLTPRIYRESPLYEEEKGIRVHRFRFPSGNTPLNRLDSIPVFSMLVYMLSGFFSAVRLILREKPDVLHGNWIVPTGLIASIAGLLTGTPVINTARGMDLRVSEKGPVRLLFKLAVRLSDRVTVVSRVMRERAELRDAELVTSGVDPLFFEISPRYDSRTILHIRSLEPVYDVQTVIRAAQKVIERLPGSRFIIAGTGSQEAFLKALSAELGAEKHVDFTGPVSNMEIAELMKRSSVYVSAATADGTSIALLEAMAAGMIPVVTDIPENRAFITHGADGYLFRPQDPADLADNIIEAMGMSLPEGVLSEKRNALRDTICWSSIAEMLISDYNQVLEKTKDKRYQTR